MIQKGILILQLCIATIAYGQYTPQQIANLYKRHQPSLTENDVQSLVISSQYTDAKSGITHVYFNQTVNGIEIFNANAQIHLDKNGHIITLHDEFVVDAASHINVSKVAIGSSTALTIAANDVNMNVSMAMNKAALPMQQNKLTIVDAAVSEEPINLKLYYLNTPAGLILTYNVELFNDKTNDWWNVRVDATTGKVIEKNNWTTHCNVSNATFSSSTAQPTQSHFLQATQLTKKENSQIGTYHVFPFPIESPIHGQREFVSGSIAKVNASPFGWHDTDGVAGPDYSVTRGNNVFADEDTLSNNGSGYSPDGGDSLVFDYAMDSTWSNFNEYLPAAITNLFYANNYIHDVFYQYGFNELSGSFQYNNYGKGGLGKDQVQADAQDGSGLGNANFSTPVDGSNGRMQMYLWPISTSSNAVINPLSVITSSAVGPYTSTLSSFGTQRFSKITAQIVVVDDGTIGDSLGCNALINGNELQGKIALIYRGGTSCSSTNKVLNAQNAGAVAVIVVNNTSSTPARLTGNNSSIFIPSVIISQAAGANIKNALENGDTVIGQFNIGKSYDSDFDNGVITHEYGHGISNRLTGGPNNSDCLRNAEQAGEGWSDFFALALTSKPGDQGTNARGMGTFLFNQPISGLGIREFKYTTDIKVNPLTYTAIKNDRGVHYVGTIWCTMLWDMYWAMVNKYGFDEDVYNGTGGNNKAIQLVIDGLKLQKCNPGFVDSRNAILLADSLLNGGANRSLLWNVFARRGLGFSANQGLSTSVLDGTAAFNLPEGVTSTGTIDTENLGRFIQLKANPVTTQAILVMPDQLMEADVLVTDISGKVLVNEHLKTDASQHISIDLSAISTGLYFLKVNNGHHLFQTKMFVQHD
jgi:extracellular elastinolytic metalloproteinase